MEKYNRTKELREFIMSHEMRYLVENGYSKVRIVKVFKVTLPDKDYWVRLGYNNQFYPITQNEVKYRVYETIDAAKAKANELRAERKKENEKKAKEKDEKLNEVVKYLEYFDIYGITKWEDGNRIVLPKGKSFVDAVKRVYSLIPKSEKADTESAYIDLLHRYIMTGVIYTQGIAFRKEQVACVKYGKDAAVMVILNDGTTIMPSSRNVTTLIRLLFGNNGDGWAYRFMRPDEKDKVEFSGNS